MQTWLGSGGSSGVYSTVYGEDARPAAIKLIQFDGLDWQHQLKTWSEVSRISHPALIRILDFGHCEIQDAPLLYVVMEQADGSLAEVLRDRPLSPAEAREVLECAATALAYLHEHGWAHCGIKPQNIMAIGDQIKLATDSVIGAGEDNGDDEIKSLGVTLAQALTQSAPDCDAAVAENLPSPFREIVRRCLQKNGESAWTASQILAYLRGQVVTPGIPPSPAPEPRRSPTPVYWIAAAMIVITAIVLLLRNGQYPAPASFRPSANDAALTPAAQEPPPPAPAKPAPPVIPAQPESPNGSWYVIAATYMQLKDAEKRAHSIMTRWPSFKAEVFSPSLENEKSYYLVTLGSNLSQKDAEAVRQRAIAAGMPADTYIQRAKR